MLAKKALPHGNMVMVLTKVREIGGSVGGGFCCIDYSRGPDLRKLSSPSLDTRKVEKQKRFDNSMSSNTS